MYEQANLLILTYNNNIFNNQNFDNKLKAISGKVFLYCKVLFISLLCDPILEIKVISSAKVIGFAILRGFPYTQPL